MGNLEIIGRWLVVVGLATVILGGVMWFAGKYLKIDSLPGTIRIEGSGFSCVFPVLASIVLSLVLTLVLNIIARLLNK